MKPELLLACARKAYPDSGDEFYKALQRTVANKSPAELHMLFENDGEFQMALQIALEDHKNGGWTFWRQEDGAFGAESWDEGDIKFAPTKPELLAKCVETMGGGG